MKLSASIVLYQTDLTPLKKVIDSYFACKSEDLQLFLVDNSPTDLLKKVLTMYPDKEIHYIFNNQNMGYGKAHNVAIKKNYRTRPPLSHSPKPRPYHTRKYPRKTYPIYELRTPR